MDPRPEVKELWDLLPHPSPLHVVRMFARNEGRRMGDFARSPVEMERFIRSAEAKDMNVYVAPNPTMSTTGARHAAADVTHWSYLLLDMDPVEEEYAPLKGLEEALLWLGEWGGRDFSKRRPLIIHSGRGAQAWVRLNDLILDDRQMEGTFIGVAYDVMKGEPLAKPFSLVTRKSARKTMGHWLKKISEKLGTIHGCRLDSCTSDLPRVMRMPGTRNIKTGIEARILEPSREVFEGFAELLVTGTPDTVFAEPEPGEVPPGTKWQTVYSKLTQKAKKYLTEGREAPGRHETAWHTATKLKECGIERAQARAAIGYANTICGPEHAMSDKELDHVIETSYGKA